MKTEKPIALVTGANRGLGLETCRQLAKKGFTVVLTSQNPEKGKKAADQLKTEIKGSENDIHYCPLDVSNPTSVDQAFQFVSEEFGRLDALINNAGIYWDESHSTPLISTPIETIRYSLETNTYGPIRMIQTFLPLLKKSKAARIVNVSSGMGQLSEMEGGSPAYRLSKTALNAVTRIASNELKEHGILVNSVCPGWVQTDMGGPEAEIPIEEGVDTQIWLATLPADGPTGGFFRHRKQIDW
jgi:NAD(P)-dependent dehydrogenase (short-subunit alcohol dehydrogenase family)